MSLLFAKTNFIKADRCNINQLNNNVFEQRQYCFCCVVIFEVLTHRLTDKLVLSWLLLLFYTSFVMILLFFLCTMSPAAVATGKKNPARSFKLLHSVVYATILE